MSMITNLDMQKIKEGWSKGLTRASFGGGKGTCQLTGSKEGFVVLYVYEDKRSLVMDFRDDATPYLFSINAYRSLKKDLDTEFPGATGLKENNLKKQGTAKIQTRPSRKISKETIDTSS